MLEQASELVSKWREPPTTRNNNRFKHKTVVLHTIPFSLSLSLLHPPLKGKERSQLWEAWPEFSLSLSQSALPFVDVLGGKKKTKCVRVRFIFSKGEGNIRHCFDFIYVFGAVVQHKLGRVSWKCSSSWRSSPALFSLSFFLAIQFWFGFFLLFFFLGWIGNKKRSNSMDGEVQRPLVAILVSRVISSPQNCWLWIRIEEMCRYFDGSSC